MRPEELFPLFKSVRTLKGVGSRTGKRVEALVGCNIIDMLWHLPSEIVDRRHAPKIAEAKSGEIGTITIEVCEHIRPPNIRLPYKIRCIDDTGEIMLVFFKAYHSYLANNFPIGSKRCVSGKFEIFGGQVQITHPDHVVEVKNLNKIKILEPVYPLTAGITLRTMRKIILAVIENIPQLGEWIDPRLKSDRTWPSWAKAIEAIHMPKTEDILDPLSPARMRLAYDELLANQISLALSRRELRIKKGRCFKSDGNLAKRVIKNLPYLLTNSQKKVLSQINKDLSSDMRMIRLLQGDVGSGKTILAILAMLNVIECGSQAAIMAPTEILANQHFITIKKIVEPVGVDVVILSGKIKGKSREETLKKLMSGKALLIVGTHALFQKNVVFKDLGIVVIDEQHRFGVHQRLNLSAKGLSPEILAMTATPIPRTLCLTSYGDMDLSMLIDKPSGRQLIDTRTISLDRLDDVIKAVGRAIFNGSKIYWVCPLIEESKALDLAAIEKRFDSLNGLFPSRVGFLHSKLGERDKDSVLSQFSSGKIEVLVTTTVIEVGLDIADATVMIIEHAERFGLAQLHQLRGRVGRGNIASTCILLYSSPLSEVARERLSVLRNTNDGFKIAEKDLKLRGAGELLGVRQSGAQVFRLANLAVHDKLLEIAKRDASKALREDPELSSKRGASLKVLLHLFNQSEAIKTLTSG